MHQSIATIDSPEFINLQPLDINPLMSSCEIKVLYVGENRNHSYITEEVASEMAKTLRGAPIVGYYKEDKEDFADHGERMIFDDEGIKFECLTKPYGFVAPDAKVWFQNFEDTDDFGNKVTRKYLMTTGYLWTGQFKECADVVKEGRPHSMELDEETLNGNWSTNVKTNMDFFIINDAIFSKLCILGEDVEPCFEGSSIKSPEVSATFTKTMDETFKKTLFTMMQELKFALEGGQEMEIDNQEPMVEETEVVETPVVEPEEKVETEEVPAVEENQDSTEAPESYKKKEDDKEDTTDDSSDKDADSSDDDSDGSDDNADKDKDDEEDKKKKYSLLEEQYKDLEAKYTELEANYNTLVEFKKTIDNEKKDALINSFYMLTDEDKADVIANKEQYSLDDIEAKLSVICVRKKVNFDLDDEEDEADKKDPAAITYSLENQDNSMPAWVKAVVNNRK